MIEGFIPNVTGAVFTITNDAIIYTKIDENYRPFAVYLHYLKN